MIRDMFSLLAWCKDEELKAHNKAAKCATWQMEREWTVRETAFKEMVSKIENSPTELHRTLTMPREFDLV